MKKTKSRELEFIGDIGDRLLSFFLTRAASSKINETYYKNRIAAEKRNIKSMISAQKVRMLKGGGMTIDSVLRETEAMGQLNIEAIRHERTVAKMKAISRRGKTQIEKYRLLGGKRRSLLN